MRHIFPPTWRLRALLWLEETRWAAQTGLARLLTRWALDVEHGSTAQVLENYLLTHRTDAGALATWQIVAPTLSSGLATKRGEPPPVPYQSALMRAATESGHLPWPSRAAIHVGALTSHAATLCSLGEYCSFTPNFDDLMAREVVALVLELGVLRVETMARTMAREGSLLPPTNPPPPMARLDPPGGLPPLAWRPSDAVPDAWEQSWMNGEDEDGESFGDEGYGTPVPH